MRVLPTLLVLVSLPALAQLNDTGVTTCLNAAGNALEACTTANTGNAAPYPRQDARFGRDAAQAAGQLPAKTGGGAAGFDFTPLDASGNTIALSGGVPVSPPACVRDNVTNLIWEVKTTSGLRSKDHLYSWYNGSTGYQDPSGYAAGAACGNTLAHCNTQAYVAAVNALSGAGRLCGATDWRLPTRRELLSITHLGASNQPIDSNFFPNTVSLWYWASDLYAPGPVGAWVVYFYYGDTGAYVLDFDNYVRLVRSGQ